ncbi:PTS mannose transporter subunit IID [Bacillus sp. 349Y]|nr:PTS mannose transporter subunit IID [Bacillus sp. 349Y]
MLKDTITLLGGFLMALLGLFSTLNIEFEWFTKESIDALVIALIALAAFGVNAYAVWKNTYIKKALKNKKEDK